MKKRIKHYKRQSKISELILNHIQNNISTYMFLGILFLFGIGLGIFFIKSLSYSQTQELKNYISQSITKSNNLNVNYLKELIVENILIITAIWFAGITIIGIIINFGIIMYRGFCIGYTISALKLTLGTWKTLAFVSSGMFLQNILFIPAMIATAVSGLKFFKDILKNRDKESFVIGAIRHTIFSSIMIVIAIISCFIEVSVSNPLLKMVLENL